MSRDTKDTWSEVRLYRLKPAPERYEAQTKLGKQKVTRESDGKKVKRDRRGQSLWDFYEIITGRETGKLGIQYKLIHLDAS